MITPGDPGTGGIGGGSTPNVCFSLADAANYIGNLEQRVSVLEQILAQLLGTNTSALQLSDFTDDLGMINSGTLNGSALGSIMTLLGKVNAYLVSAGDNPFDSGGSTFDLGLGAFQMVSTSTVLNSGAAFKSNPVYTFDGGTYQGGFYYECRFAFVPIAAAPDVPTTTLQNTRAFVGLGNIFANSSIWNTDNPPGTYICFNFSKPRGDTTWKFIINDMPSDLGAPSSATVIDTGMPVRNYAWYDFVIRCEPFSTGIQWEVKDVYLETVASGTQAIPNIYRNPPSAYFMPNHVGSDGYYCAGVSAFQCTSGGDAIRYGVHHMFAQVLDTENN